MTQNQLLLPRKGRKPMSRPEPNVPLPSLADPDNPMLVARSHLKKMELGKSSSSNKVALITRLHRSVALHEFWCASWEESCVILLLASLPEVRAMAEQYTRIDYDDEDGGPRYTMVDLHVLLHDGFEILVSTKYAEKAQRASYVAEVAHIAGQVPRRTADGFIIATRAMFPKVFRDCAKTIHHARRGWDPEADFAVLEAAAALGDQFYFGELVERARLGARAHRAAIRLIGDGDIGKHLMDPFAQRTVCWRTN